jgi:hypothetical protein
VFSYLNVSLLTEDFLLLIGILESTIIDHDSSHLAPNLVGLPVMLRTGDQVSSVPPYHTMYSVLLLEYVLVLIGDQDSSVPPYHTRRMARHLEECGVDVTFTEVRGKVPHVRLEAYIYEERIYLLRGQKSYMCIYTYIYIHSFMYVCMYIYILSYIYILIFISLLTPT